MRYFVPLFVFFVPFIGNAQSVLPPITDTITVQTEFRQITVNYSNNASQFCLDEGFSCNKIIWVDGASTMQLASDFAILSPYFIDASGILTPQDETYIFNPRPNNSDISFWFADTELTFDQTMYLAFYDVGVDQGYEYFTLYLSNTGFSSDHNAFGLPSPVDVISYVTSGVQNTGSTALPIGAGIVGVPIAFAVGRFVIGIIRSAV